MEKRMFQNGIHYHRAVIPAAGFYEWSRQKEKNTFYRKDGKPLYLAGFYDRFDKEDRFVILTTVANASMRPVHDRMPLVLEKDQIRSWLWEEKQAQGMRVRFLSFWNGMCLMNSRTYLNRKSDRGLLCYGEPGIAAFSMSSQL